MKIRRTWALELSLLAMIASADRIEAQRFTGQVIEQGLGVPVATAIVTLVDGDGEVAAVSIADEEGMYRLDAPSPGIYRIEAARIGYDRVETPPLEVRSAERTYRVDLEMRVAPVLLEGIEVEVGPSQAERAVRLFIGLHPASLRNEIVHYEEIQSHLARGHSLPDLVRWTNRSGIIVFHTSDGPCFSARGTGCMPVYLNNFQLPQGFSDAVPLDMAHAVGVVMPGETILYPQGAIIVFTEAWLR